MLCLYWTMEQLRGADWLPQKPGWAVFREYLTLGPATGVRRDICTPDMVRAKVRKILQ
jgi:hypothetical protein